MRMKMLVILFWLLFVIPVIADDVVSVHYDVYIGGVPIYVGRLVDQNNGQATFLYAGDDVVHVGAVILSGLDMKTYLFPGIIIKKSGSNWEILADADTQVVE